MEMESDVVETAVSLAQPTHKQSKINFPQFNLLKKTSCISKATHKLLGVACHWQTTPKLREEKQTN